MSTYPLFIDNIAFAKKNERLAGSLPLADCPRLSELLQATENSQALKNKARAGDGDAVINYVLQGETNAAGQHFLHMMLDVNLTVTCQRCLEEMPLKQTLKFNYLIGGANINEADASELEGNDEIDLQEASQAMDVIALIEDEVIMAMPIAPVHDEDCSAASSQSGEKLSPFAVLKGLLRSAE